MASIPVHGGHKEAFGMLQVGSAEVEETTRHDPSFLQRPANSVTTAVGLHASRASRTEEAELVVQRRSALAGRLMLQRAAKAQPAAARAHRARPTDP